MINPTLLSDSLATKVATEVVYSKLRDAAMGYVVDEIVSNIAKVIDGIITELKEKDYPHKELFEALFKSLASHEKKFMATLHSIWEDERKIIIANIKKMKKAWLQKDAIDQLLYPRKQSEARIAKETKKVFEVVMVERGNEELAKIEAELRKPKKQTPIAELVADFDVENPEVQKWLEGYTADLSKALEEVNTNKLRRELIEGMHKGEGIPELMKRVNLTYDSWNKFRAERIARTETLMASNKAAVQSYIQSGVVKSKMWVTHFDHRTCPSCEVLDGQIIALEENFFNKGDPDEVITSGGHTFTFKNDYRDIGEPPRHALCRCSIAASFEDMTRVQRVDFHKNLTGEEKKLIKKWSETEYKNIRSWVGMTPDQKRRLLNFYHYEQHRQAWITQQLKEAKQMELIFKKYKDGMRTKKLYRSISKVKDSLYNELKGYKSGDLFRVDKAMQSWSYEKKILNKFTYDRQNNVQFILKEGRKLTLELDIEKYSKFPFEKEVIMNTKEFKIIKIEEIVMPVPGYPKEKTRILKIFLEEVSGG